MSSERGLFERSALTERDFCIESLSPEGSFATDRHRVSAMNFVETDGPLLELDDDS